MADVVQGLVITAWKQGHEGLKTWQYNMVSSLSSYIPGASQLGWKHEELNAKPQLWLKYCGDLRKGLKDRSRVCEMSVQVRQNWQR